MVEQHNAGQGPVLLDIGGTVGALIVAMPAELVGCEIEIRSAEEGHSHPHPHPHPHSHSHPHDHGDPHDHRLQRPHVGVVNRPAYGSGGPMRPTAVFGELEAGDYELYVRPSGPVQLRATVRGGAVTELVWPAGTVT